MLQEIMHIGITVSDMDKSINFYKDILGLVLKGEMIMTGPETDKLFNKKNCKVRVTYLNSSDNLVSPSIELIQFVSNSARIDKADLHKTSISEICFYVNDIEKEYKNLKEKGVQFISKPQFFDLSSQGFGKSKAVYFKDPDGIILELLQPIV